MRCMGAYCTWCGLHRLVSRAFTSMGISLNVAHLICTQQSRGSIDDSLDGMIAGASLESQDVIDAEYARNSIR